MWVFRTPIQSRWTQTRSGHTSVPQRRSRLFWRKPAKSLAPFTSKWVPVGAASPTLGGFITCQVNFRPVSPQCFFCSFILPFVCLGVGLIVVSFVGLALTCFFSSNFDFSLLLLRSCSIHWFVVRVVVPFACQPNYPGVASHYCNGGFLTVPSIRRQGLGSVMGRAYLRLAKDIGYRASMFNLVFVVNEASVALWRRLGFRELAVLPGVGNLKGHGYTDAIQFFHSLHDWAPPDDDGLELSVDVEEGGGTGCGGAGPVS